MGNKIMITESQYKVLLQNINEQSSQTTIGGGSLGKKHTEKKQFSQSTGYDVTIPENEWDNYISVNEKSLLKLWSTKSKSFINWNEIKISDKRFAVGILESFIEGDYSDCQIKKKGDIQTTPDDKDEKIDEYDSVTLSLPVSIPKNAKFFEDNEWVLNVDLQSMIKKDIETVVRQGVSQIISKNPELVKRPNVYLKRLSIKTSCSRLPNGIPQRSPGAEKYRKSGISFFQLATERNNNVKDVMINQLRELNVSIDDKSLMNIIQDSKGLNGDGTSGGDYRPNPKFNDAQLREYRKQFNSNKFLKIEMDLVFNTLVEPIKKEDKVIPGTKLVNVDYEVKLLKSRGVSVDIPSVSLEFGSGVARTIVSKINKSKCEFFDNNSDSWWSDPKLGYQ